MIVQQNKTFFFINFWVGSLLNYKGKESQTTATKEIKFPKDDKKNSNNLVT